ncbi:MAG: hypothetical protein AB1689_15165 [Thermodesulfobacteriota bacterium]
MSTGELVVVRFEGAAALPAALPFAVRRVVDTRELATPAEVAAAAETEHARVLWLPAWSRPGPRTLEAVAAWLERPGGTPRVARARLELAHAGGSAPADRRVVLSEPGAVELVGERVVAGSHAAIEDLAEPWTVAVPETLREHLEQVDVQTSAAARLRHAAREPARWRSLTWLPLAFALRALAGARGSRRELLPHVVIEAYREVLVAAKLWELAHVTGRA